MAVFINPKKYSLELYLKKTCGDNSGCCLRGKSKEAISGYEFETCKSCRRLLEELYKKGKPFWIA